MLLRWNESANCHHPPAFRQVSYLRESLKRSKCHSVTEFQWCYSVASSKWFVRTSSSSLLETPNRWNSLSWCDQDIAIKTLWVTVSHNLWLSLCARYCERNQDVATKTLLSRHCDQYIARPGEVSWQAFAGTVIFNQTNLLIGVYSGVFQILEFKSVLFTKDSLETFY